MNRALALLLCLLAFFAGWRVYSSGQSKKAVSVAGPLKPVSPESKICFVPIEDFPVDRIETLVRYYHEKFNVEITIAKNVPIDASLRDASRGQVRAEALASSLRTALPEYDASTILIGFTSEDIYPVSQNWRFAFGWRTGAARAAVVSTSRMSLPYEGLPAQPSTVMTRLRKMVTKDIGILYFGLPQSSNPKSVLYNQIMGIEELDEVGEDF